MKNNSREKYLFSEFDPSKIVWLELENIIRPHYANLAPNFFVRSTQIMIHEIKRFRSTHTPHSKMHQKSPNFLKQPKN